MSIYAAPATTFEATVSNGTTGLLTVGVRIMDGQGATTTARSTAGIVETPAGSGIYTATLTAPSTAGTYTVVWDVANAAPYAAEDLTVTYDLPTVGVGGGYGGSPQTSNSDAVRALVGDVGTSTSATYLDDAEYDYFISVTSSNFIAAQLAANSLAALFAGAAASAVGNGYVTRKVGDLTITKSDASQAAAGYRSLAQKFGRMAAANITPYAGGLTVSGKLDVGGDTDRVRPAFLRNLYDNKNALNAGGNLST